MKYTRAKQPAPYKDDDSYNYNQITENDSIEKEPTVPNATERNDNNERSTENVRDDKEHFTGNYDKDNSSGSSQGRIEVDKDVLSTENNEVESSKIIGVKVYQPVPVTQLLLMPRHLPIKKHRTKTSLRYSPLLPH